MPNRARQTRGGGTRPPSPGILRVDHVGVVVSDLDGTCAALARILGSPRERRRLGEVGLSARVFRVGGAAVEVLAFDGPIPGVDPRVTRASGLQHVAFRVADLDVALERLAACGVQPLPGFPRQGLHGRIAFVEDPVTGCLVELLEARVRG